MECIYCQSALKELRPYGPKGAWICFSCMKDTTDREREAKKQFLLQTEACNGVAVIDGSTVGPYPYIKPILS